MKKLELWNRFSKRFDLLVKRQEKRFLQHNYRRLSLATSGRLYVLFTIILGVAAIIANNNLLFLLESFLLGGLILSGVLSEYAISSISLRWMRNSVPAGEPSKDLLYVTNNGFLPQLCVDIGEFRGDEFYPVSFVPILNPGETVELNSNQVFVKRGIHSFNGWGVETSYPFGFAKKLRWHDNPGSRIIWPKRISVKSKFSTSLLNQPTGDFSSYKDGEIEQNQFNSDSRKAVFSKTLATRNLYSRVHELTDQSQTWTLTPSDFDPVELEMQLSKITTSLLDRKQNTTPQLILNTKKGRFIFSGVEPCLNALAKVEVTS